MKRPIFTIILGTAMLAAPAYAETTTISNTPVDAMSVAVDSSKVVAEVTQQVKASPEKAAAIVKAAISKYKADAELVSKIVVAAVTAAPDQTAAVSTMAMAVAPDAFGEVAIALAKLDGYNMDEVGLGGQNPLNSPGDAEALAAFLTDIATGEITVKRSNDGKGERFIVKFVGAVMKPRIDGPGVRFPIAFDMPRGLLAGFGSGIVRLSYDDNGNTTGIIIDTSPTAP